jgi:hypothetical protein
VFLGNCRIASALRRSRLCIGTKIGLVTNIEGLKKYLAKERTPQASYRRRDLCGRIRGGIPSRNPANDEQGQAALLDRLGIVLPTRMRFAEHERPAFAASA